MTPAEFLLARIAEDEADAELALRSQEPGEPWGWDTVPGEGLHINRWSPTRVLAECEAKRRIVDFWTALAERIATDWTVVRLLALPYADHPDYDESWRP